MILVDTNVLMYAAGAAHRLKDPSTQFLERVASGAVDAVLDAEVLQEILHRYRALGRWAEGRQVFDLARTLFPVVLPVTADVMDRARAVLDQNAHLTARDAVHVAVVLANDLDAICSYDGDFDSVAGVVRVEPEAVS